MRLLLRFSALVDRCNRQLGAAVAWLTLGMVLIGAWNALARYAGKYIGLDLSSNGLIEAQWYMFSLVFLLGAAYTLGENEHVRVDVFYGQLGARGKAWVNLLGGVFLLIPFCLFAIRFSWPSVAASFAVKELSPDPGGLPRWPIKGVIPLAFALLIVQGLSEIIKNLARVLGLDVGGPTEPPPSAEGGA